MNESRFNTYVLNSVRCAAPACSNVRAHLEHHWFVVLVGEGEFTCRRYDPNRPLQSSDQPVCGQACALKLFDHYLAAIHASGKPAIRRSPRLVQEAPDRNTRSSSASGWAVFRRRAGRSTHTLRQPLSRQLKRRHSLQQRRWFRFIALKVINMSHGRSPKLVPVYRMFQFTRTSPCQFGNPCPTCVRYEADGGCQEDYYFRGVTYICERAVPAPPAFLLSRRKALSLVRNGLARLIHEAYAVQLTFSVVTNIRDESSKADEELVMAFLAGSARARAAIYEAWSAPPPSIPAKVSEPVPIYPFV